MLGLNWMWLLKTSKGKTRTRSVHLEKKNVFEFYISLTNSTLTMSPGYLSLFPLPEVKVVFMCVAQGSHHLAYAGLAGWQ